MNSKTKDLLKEVEKNFYAKGMEEGRANLMQEQLEAGPQAAMDDIEGDVQRTDSNMNILLSNSLSSVEAKKKG